MKRAFSNVRLLLSLSALVGIVVISFALWSPTQKAVSKSVMPAAALTASYAEFSKADAVTGDIRNSHKQFVRIPTENAVDRANAAKAGRIVGDYGSFVVVATDRGKRVERGTGRQLLETTVNLPGASFDPVDAPPAGTVNGESDGKGSGYYVVQLGTPADDRILDSLRDAGIEILQYIPHQAFIVYAQPGAISKAAEHSRVRWVGRFLPEYKASTALREQLVAARTGVQIKKGISPLELSKTNTAIFDVAVFKRANFAEVANQIVNVSGGNIISKSEIPNNFFNVMRVQLPIDNVEAITNIADVITVDAYFRPMAEDERSAQIVAGNYTNSTTISAPGYNPLTQFLVDGTNVTVSVGDDGISIPGNGGFYLTSSNTKDGPLHGATAGASGGHGHLNASIIAGSTPFGALDGTGYNYGRGIAPGANIVNLPFLKSGNTFTDADLANDSVTTTGVNGVLGSISNNSWGAGTNLNAYDSFAATYDGFVRDASTAASIDPLVLVFSAGNCGQSPANTACSSQSGLTRPKIAKNIIAVGSTENLRPEIGPTDANSMDDMSVFSSRGPAADTRIKPDISAPGGAVSGSRAGDGSSVTGSIDANHAYSYGTSHAAPQVAGAAALITQWWKGGHAGANPSPALVKAAIINGGVNMTGTGAASGLPNGDEGWGRINLKNVLNTGVASTYVNQEVIFPSTGSSQIYSGTVADNTKPLRVTLVWTDPPGAADPALVNNLDLTVTAGGNTYRGNVFSGSLSTTGGVADTRNNVENVWLPAGTTGPITITVTATAINGDGVLGNADTTDQHFALVVYNSAVTPTLAPVVTQGGAATVTAESFVPANSAPDPGETVTVNIPLMNVGSSNTTNLVATLQPTGGVTNPQPVGGRTYGVLVAGGPAVTQPFTFTAQGVCGSTITLTFALNDNGTDLGIVTFTMQLGTTVTVTSLNETFDAVTAPALPAGWTAATTTGTLPVMVTSTTTPFSAPNAVFSSEVAAVSNTELVSPSIAIPANGGQVSFRNLFNLEASGTTPTLGWDGMILEISINGGAYTDFVAAGGIFTAGGYTRGIDTGFSSPIAGQQAWSGLSAGTTAAPAYILTTGTLPPAASGQNIRLKWRVATDSSAVATGVIGARIDNLTVSVASPVCSTATAAGVSVSGRVFATGEGRGLRGAKVLLTDENGNQKSVFTSAFGSFNFEDVEPGHTYIVTVMSRRFQYAPQVLQINDNVADLVFSPQ